MTVSSSKRADAYGDPRIYQAVSILKDILSERVKMHAALDRIAQNTRQMREDARACIERMEKSSREHELWRQSRIAEEAAFMDAQPTKLVEAANTEQRHEPLSGPSQPSEILTENKQSEDKVASLWDRITEVVAKILSYLGLIEVYSKK